MSLTLTINGVDVTQRWRVFESRWTNRAYMGESMQSEFIIDDDTGETYQHSDLATRKIVEVWEDASGTPVCMYRGRVANKTLGRGPRIQGDAMRWTVQTEDYNIDLRGIRIDDSTRPAESDRERVLAYLAGYLSGAASTNPNARDSTDLDGEYVRNASLVDLPAETYTDTFPSDVFGRICDFSAKTFFAFVGDDGTGHLYYAPHDNTYYSSDIAITDDELLADGVDVYNPFRGSQTGAHDGQHLISGGSLRYGSDQFYEYSHAGSETDHDKWEEHFTDEYVVNEGSAQNFLEAMVASRNNEDFNYTVTISMAAEEAHRIKAGMMVPLRLASADLPTESEQRAVQVTHEPVVEHLDYRYLVTIELGVPRGKAFRRNIRTKPGPFAPTPTTPGTSETVTARLYYTGQTDVLSGMDNTDYSVSWDVSDAEGPYRLRSSPQNTVTNSGAGPNPWTGEGVSPQTVVNLLYSCRLDEVSNLLDVVQEGGTFRTVLRSANRDGPGVNEAAQENYPRMTARVWRPGTSSFLGTLFSVTGPATRFDITGTYPSIPMSATVSALATAASTDYLLVELGGEHDAPITSGTGWSYRPGDSSATDLPYVVDSVADQNSWAEFSGTTSGTAPTAGNGNPALIGTNSGVYQNFDDTEHFDSSTLSGGEREPTVLDDEGEGFRVGTLWLHPTTGRVWWLADNTDGAAEWILVSDPTASTPGATLTIEEEDGAPSGVFDTLKVSNGTLTDNGDGSASLDISAGVHSHGGSLAADFAGVLVRRTTDFTTSNSNDSVPDFDTEVYDTDGAWAIGNPDELVIPAAWDGLMVQVYGQALWATGADNYTEMKVYHNATRPVGNLQDDKLVAVTQHDPATSYNTGQIVLSAPVQVATGDTFLMALRNPAAETVSTYHDISIQFGAWVVGQGSGASTTHWEPVIFDNAGTPEIVYFQNAGGVWDIVMHEVDN
jgi:hypothetical protein